VPGFEFHQQTWKEMRNEIRGLYPVDEFIIQIAIDSHDSIPGKMRCHLNFIDFLTRYAYLKGYLRDNIRVGMRRTLKYYWINHVVMDFIHNKDHRFLPSLDDFYAIFWTHGRKYAAYARKLLLKAGFRPKHILLVENDREVIVRKQLFTTRNEGVLDG
jgi:hypothetical protein